MKTLSRLLLGLALASGAALAAQNPLKELLEAADPQIRSTRRQELADAVKKDPLDDAAWMSLAQFSYQHEEPAETEAVLRKAISSLPKPGVFWRFLAQVHLDDAASGPNGIQRPNQYRPRRPASTLDEKAFRKQSFEAALEALDKAIACGGEVARESSRIRANVLMGLDRWPEAEAQASSLLTNRWTADDAALLAFCVLQQGRKEEAMVLLKAYLEKAPRARDLHAVKSRVHAALGEKEAAAEEEAQFKFYARLLPDSTLEYSAENQASLEKLFGRKEGASGMFGADRLNEQIKAEIERLAGVQTEASSELLATLAWSHFAHGELEDRAFSILGERKDTRRLRRILDHASSTCTIGSCLDQMVELRMEGTFEVLRDMLDKDGGIFPMGIVAKMAMLEDPRSGAVLREYTKSKEAPFFELALACLGKFDSPETRTHLEGWLKDEAAAPFAAAGLHRLTWDDKLLAVMEKGLGTLGRWEAMPITNHLETVDKPEARRILNEFNARKDREEAEEKAARDATSRQDTAEAKAEAGTGK